MHNVAISFQSSPYFLSHHNSMKVRINPRTHANNERLVRDEMVEYGGIMDLTGEREVGYKGQPRKGVYNNVDVPKGLVQFHTHPAGCQKVVCTMGVPSIEDLLGFANAVIRGDTLIHVLYSREGTYVIMLQPEVRRILSANNSAILQPWLDIVEESLAKYKVTHPVTYHTYDDWREGWIHKAMDEGFDIQHWAIGVPPTLHIYSNRFDSTTTPCDDYQTYRERARVETEVQQYALDHMKQRCQNTSWRM